MPVPNCDDASRAAAVIASLSLCFAEWSVSESSAHTASITASRDRMLGRSSFEIRPLDQNHCKIRIHSVAICIVRFCLFYFET
jgi:hypothetical protein